MSTAPQPSKRNKQLQVHVGDYEHPLYLVKLKPVIEKFKEAVPDAKMDAKLFGQSLAGMLQLMEDALGKNANPEFKKFPKLPMSVFRDYRPEGPLLLIAKAFWAHMQARTQGKRIPFEVPINRRENMELVQSIRQQLMRGGYVKSPCVWISPTCGHDIPLLAQSIRRLQGEMAKDVGDPSITHAVYPFGEHGDPDDGQEYMRTLEHRGPKTALVHYWYLPDSYDEHIAADVAPPDVETQHGMPGVIKVYARWLRDSEAFNEWMNPNDYWTEEYEKEVEAWEKANPELAAAAAAGLKRPREEEEQAMPAVPTAAAAAAAAANLRMAKKTRTEEEPGAGVVVADCVTRQVIQLPNKLATDLKTSTEDISYGQRSKLEGQGVPQAPLPSKPEPSEGPTAGPTTTEAQAEAAPVEENPAVAPSSEAQAAAAPVDAAARVPYRVPAHAAWFAWDKVHSIEVREVPEFFSDSDPAKTPDIYRAIRNELVNLYRQNVHRHLTWSEAKRVLAGDAAAVLHVWEFCNRWGLINFQAPPVTVAGVDAADVVPEEMGGASGARVVALPPAASVDAIFRFGSTSASAHVSAVVNGGTTGDYKLISRPDALQDPGAPSGDRKLRFFCNSRPWVDCTAKRYHCTKIPDVDLCPEAYASGAFPAGCTAKDFILIEQGKEAPATGDGWTEQETLLLLEGLELYGDKWDDVSEHVGSKSQLACILHFLSLPIEEQFVDEAVAGQEGVPGPPAEGEEAAEEEEAFVPFADAGNPIMAQLAFLTTMVGPRVAAAAAKRALEFLGETEDADDMQAAAATALSAAAVKAKMLAQQEEREIQRLTIDLIDLQYRKIDLKYKQLNQFEQALQKDKLHLESMRKKLAAEITDWQRAKVAATAAPAPAQQAEGLAPAPQAALPSAHEGQ